MVSVSYKDLIDVRGLAGPVRFIDMKITLRKQMHRLSKGFVGRWHHLGRPQRPNSFIKALPRVWFTGPAQSLEPHAYPGGFKRRCGFLLLQQE